MRKKENDVLEENKKNLILRKEIEEQKKYENKYNETETRRQIL